MGLEPPRKFAPNFLQRFPLKCLTKKILRCASAGAQGEHLSHSGISKPQLAILHFQQYKLRTSKFGFVIYVKYYVRLVSELNTNLLRRAILLTVEIAGANIQPTSTFESKFAILRGWHKPLNPGHSKNPKRKF